MSLKVMLLHVRPLREINLEKTKNSRTTHSTIIHHLSQAVRHRHVVSSTDTGTIISIASFAVLVWIFITFMPWIFMGLGGTLGAWIGKKTGKVSLAIVLSILAGGYGFYQGNQWQQEWNESGTIEEVKSVQE